MKSLFIGINYQYTNNTNIKVLKNAVKDAKRAYRYIKFNYPDTSVKILTDVAKFHSNYFDNSMLIYPSRENIIRALEWLNDDVMFLHISSHALPEGIVPADYKSDRDLINLQEFIYQKKGQLLFCVLDTCHSAALLNLSFKKEFVVCINSCTSSEKSNDAESFSKDLYSFINNKFLIFKKSKKSWADVVKFMKEYNDPRQSPHLISSKGVPLEKNIFEI